MQGGVHDLHRADVLVVRLLLVWHARIDDNSIETQLLVNVDLRLGELRIRDLGTLVNDAGQAGLLLWRESLVHLHYSLNFK